MINNLLLVNTVGLERVTIELLPDIILEEEEEDGFYKWANKYDQWDNNPYIPEERTEIPHI